MGISVDKDRRVSYCVDNNRLLSTSPAVNPTDTPIQGLVVDHAFKRLRAKRNKGDGNPIIHALKGNNGYSISAAEQRRFYPDLHAVCIKIAQKYQSQSVQFLPMPSSSPIAFRFARFMARRVPNSTVLSGCFYKLTNNDIALQLIGNQAAREHSDYGALLSRLQHSPQEAFSMKLVDTKLRKYVVPIAFNVSVPSAAFHAANLVIVDDLMASGTTLLAARDLLLSQTSVQSSGAVVSALTMFSSL